MFAITIALGLAGMIMRLALRIAFGLARVALLIVCGLVRMIVRGCVRLASWAAERVRVARVSHHVAKRVREQAH